MSATQDHVDAGAGAETEGSEHGQAVSEYQRPSRVQGGVEDGVAEGCIREPAELHGMSPLPDREADPNDEQHEATRSEDERPPGRALLRSRHEGHRAVRGRDIQTKFSGSCSAGLIGLLRHV